MVDRSSPCSSANRALHADQWFASSRVNASVLGAALMRHLELEGATDYEIVGADWFPGLDEEATGVHLDDGSFRPVGSSLAAIVESIVSVDLVSTLEVGTIHLVLHVYQVESAQILVRLFPRPELLPTLGDRVSAIRLQPEAWWGWEMTPGGQLIGADVMAHVASPALEALVADCAHPSMFYCSSALEALRLRDPDTRSRVLTALSQRGWRSDDPF